MKTIEFTYGSRDVQDFVSQFAEGRLNLEPGFQRNSVWSLVDRKKLILSISQNYPIPSVFLYRTKNDNGRLEYIVLDGKQRLESLLMFMGCGKFRSDRFSVRTAFEADSEVKEWDWSGVKKAGYEHYLTGYRIQTVEVAGELSDIIDLFVRINSTGKSLTSQEKRHARFYHSDFLKTAGQLGKRYETFFAENKILSKGQLDRMKHIELICELLASIQMEGLIHKKTALDKIISGHHINQRILTKSRNEFVQILNLVKRVFPNFRSTRFAFSAEFYSLFMLVWEYNRQKMILTDAARNKQAQKLLEWMSNGVDELRGQISKAKGATPEQQLFAAYLFTTRGDSDSSTTRKRRQEVLHQLFGGLFEVKDEKRIFSPDQRRLFWNSTETKACFSCGESLSWENFTIDHIKSYASGGKTSLKNANLMCRSCNSRKGRR